MNNSAVLLLGHVRCLGLLRRLDESTNAEVVRDLLNLLEVILDRVVPKSIPHQYSCQMNRKAEGLLVLLSEEVVLQVEKLEACVELVHKVADSGDHGVIACSRSVDAQA